MYLLTKYIIAIFQFTARKCETATLGQKTCNTVGSCITYFTFDGEAGWWAGSCSRCIRTREAGNTLDSSVAHRREADTLFFSEKTYAGTGRMCRLHRKNFS